MSYHGLCAINMSLAILFFRSLEDVCNDLFVKVAYDYFLKNEDFYNVYYKKAEKTMAEMQNRYFTKEEEVLRVFSCYFE